VTPALLPEIRTRGEKVYLLWRSTVRVSTDADSESKTVRKLRPNLEMIPKKPVPALVLQRHRHTTDSHSRRPRNFR
jgi:hypothetical protein